MKLGVNISRIAGFTLVELLVTLAVAAILATAAAPMLSGFLARSQMDAVINDYTGALTMARMEAVSRNVCVSVCRRATSGAAQCAGEDGAWTSGWIVYDNPSCTRDATATEPPSASILRAREQLPETISLKREEGGDVPGTVTFTPRGVLLNLSQAASLQIHDARYEGDSHDRFLALSGTGRVREKKKKGDDS